MRITLAIIIALATISPIMAKGGKGKDPSNVTSYWCASHSSSALCKH